MVWRCDRLESAVVMSNTKTRRKRESLRKAAAGKDHGWMYNRLCVEALDEFVKAADRHRCQRDPTSRARRPLNVVRGACESVR